MALRTLDGSLGVAIIGFQGEGLDANPSPKGTLLLPPLGDIFIALQHYCGHAIDSQGPRGPSLLNIVILAAPGTPGSMHKMGEPNISAALQTDQICSKVMPTTPGFLRIISGRFQCVALQNEEFESC